MLESLDMCPKGERDDEDGPERAECGGVSSSENVCCAPGGGSLKFWKLIVEEGGARTEESRERDGVLLCPEPSSHFAPVAPDSGCA